MNNLIIKIDEFISRMNLKRYWKNLFLVGLVFVTLITIIPMAICSIVILPDGNDLTFAKPVYDYVSNNGFSLNVVSIAANNAIKYYKEWTGAYSSVFFTSLEPFAFGNKYAFLHFFILIIAFFVSIYYFLNTFLIRLLKCDKIDFYIVLLLISNLFIQYIPSIYNGFYWFNGSFYNTFGFYMFLIYISKVAKLFFDDTLNKTFFVIEIFLLSAFLGGCNFSTSLILLMILVTVFILSLVIRTVNRDKVFLLAYSTVTLFIFFMIAVLAPGNSLRAQCFTQRNPILAILYSFVYAVRHILNYTDLAIFLLLFITSIFCYMSIRKWRFSYRFPLIIFIASFALFSATYTSVSYAESMMPPIRQVNIQIWFMYLLMIFNFVYVLGWLENNFVTQTIKSALYSLKNNNATTSLLILFMIIYVFIAWEPDRLTGALAIKALNNIGPLKQELDERYEILENDTIKTVTFNKLENVPELFYGYSDFQEVGSKKEWINIAFAIYYDKDEIKLREDTSILSEEP